ncbi:MAG TPA: hypothetical protein VJV78_04525 [Polyangiales bacterium]|nr:hypothetical protein [Polyangiales bacterium]
MSFALHRYWVFLLAIATACADDDAVEEGPQKHLASSPTHTCAIREAGLYCWGGNGMGELGNQLKEDSEQAVAATVAGSDVVEVAAATGRTCVRRSSGQVACWGANERGQIGDGTRNDTLTPVAASGIADARQIALDDGSTCVVRGSEGQVACWGNSPSDAPDEGALTAQLIPGITGAVEVSSGAMGSYCARGAEGWVKCWVFDPDHHEWNPPVDVPALSGARAIGMTGFDEVCAIVASGQVQCHNLPLAQTATLESSEDTVELVTAGSLSACAQDSQGAWHIWNVLPVMLHNIGSPRIEIPSDQPVLELVLAGFRACALRSDHSVVCANANDVGLTGTPNVANFPAVAGLPN